MALSHAEVAQFLIQRGLLDPRSVVASGLSIQDTSRRNSNFRIVSQRETSYLLKQGIGPERAATIANEASTYLFLRSRGANHHFDPFLPQLCLYEPQEHLLVLELLPDAQNLHNYHFRLGRFPTTVAATLGDALGKLHTIDVAIDDASISSRSAPWVLSIHRPDLRLYHAISSANLQLIMTIQQYPDFGCRLDDLRREWECSALVHYDLKWENVVVAPTQRGRAKQLKLVDWELAGLGDPAWDVGSVFGEYLTFWFNSIPVTGEAPPDQLAQVAKYPLRVMQPAIRSFWQAYTRATNLEPTACTARLIRAARYAAGRLVQTAFEQGQTEITLNSNTLGLLQLSFNILQRPLEAVVHLLSIQLNTAPHP